jgi:hypothetical protein
MRKSGNLLKGPVNSMMWKGGIEASKGPQLADCSRNSIEDVALI